MLKILVAVVALAGCVGDDSEPLPEPDAGVAEVAPDVSIDAASPDAPPDTCWQHKYPMCGQAIYDICVPYDGCGEWYCEGQRFAYCGPQGHWMP